MESSILGKITKILVLLMFTVLLFSFAVWGIGDVFRGKTSDVVAKVGSREITEPQLREVAAMEARRMRETYKNVVLPEQVFKDIEKGVLYEMVNEALISQEIERLGLRVSKEDVINEISTNPIFYNPQGKFDRDRFKKYLGNLGVSEAQFIERVQHGIAARSLMGSFTVYKPESPRQGRLLYGYLGQSRTVDVLTIPADTTSKVDEPSAEALQKFYEEHKNEYKAPETRDITVAYLDNKSIASRLKINDKDLKEVFDKMSDQYQTPERRKLQHIVIAADAKDKAEKAYAALKSGESFEKVAKEYANAEGKQLEYGTATREQLFEEMRDPVFKLKKGEYTPLISTDLGYHIFRVTDIIPPKSKSFDDVKDEIRTNIEVERSGTFLYAMQAEIEDGLAGGQNLEQVAKRMEMPYKKITGMGAGDKPEYADLPKLPNLIELSFKTDEGTQSQLTQTPDGKYTFIINVDKVQGERVRPLEEVKAKLIAQWKQNQRQLQETASAEKAAAAIAKGEDIHAVASKFGGTVKTINDISRIKTTPERTPLPLPMMMQVYSLPKGASTDAQTAPGGGFLIAKVTDVKQPENDKLTEDHFTIMGKLEDMYGKEVMEQFLVYLQDRYPVKVYGDKLGKVRF
ncbi:MAG: hypothetical protein EB060_10170 [Proteobacteria bacterium]|nr:hypothetical protein [Pseudomonadota bacterium]